jgi:hypothetical protein
MLKIIDANLKLITLMKERMKWVGHKSHMKEMQKAYRNLV